jgi:hypothetical protein
MATTPSPFIPIQTQNSELQRMQNNVSTAVSQQANRISSLTTALNSNPTTSGVIVTVQFNATLTDVSAAHNLGSPALFLQGSCTTPGAVVNVSPNNTSGNSTPNQTLLIQLWTPADGTSTSPIALTSPVSVTLLFYPS